MRGASSRPAGRPISSAIRASSKPISALNRSRRMLEVRALTAGYGQATILHEIDLTVGAGTVVALIGANGAGKSTLVKTVAGLLPARAGSISFDGTRIDVLAPAARVLRGLSLVPEGRQVFGGLSVEENLR